MANDDTRRAVVPPMPETSLPTEAPATTPPARPASTETIPGGIYRTPDGRFLNAEGQEVNKDGSPKK